MEKRNREDQKNIQKGIESQKSRREAVETGRAAKEEKIWQCMREIKSLEGEDFEALLKKLAEVEKLNRELAIPAEREVGEVNVGWEVVCNGKRLKKVQGITVMQNNFSILEKVIEVALNKINDLIKELSVTRGWEDTWKIHTLLKYKKDGEVYELGWIIENIASNITAKEVTFTFMQHVAKATLQNAVIRCFPHISDVEYMVIKGVPMSMGMEEELFQMIKKENADKKPF